MKISVIIPNYNHSKYLHQRIDSVLNQTFQDFEVIILDDCSTDNSREVIEQYRHHPKVSCIVYNEQNSGSTFRQWKKGIELAKGEWIWIAESDDWCEHTLLENLLNKVQSGSGIVLAYCQSYSADADSNVSGDLSWSTDHLDMEHWNSDFINSGKDEIKSYLLYQNTIPNASAVIFRKDAFEQADKCFEKMKLCGDWMLWIQMLKSGNIAYTARPLNYFRMHNATTRVIDSPDKKKLRLQEEYQVITNIKETVGRLDTNTVQKRLVHIKQAFAGNVDKQEIFHYLLYPARYKASIPYFDLLFYYLKSKLSWR